MVEATIPGTCRACRSNRQADDSQIAIGTAAGADVCSQIHALRVLRVLPSPTVFAFFQRGFVQVVASSTGKGQAEAVWRSGPLHCPESDTYGMPVTRRPLPAVKTLGSGSRQEPQSAAGQINRGRVDKRVKLLADTGDLGREPV